MTRFTKAIALYDSVGAVRSFPTPPYPSTHNLGHQPDEC